MATRGAAQQVSTRMTKGRYGLILHKITQTHRPKLLPLNTNKIISENRMERNNIDRTQQVSILGNQCGKEGETA